MKQKIAFLVLIFSSHAKPMLTPEIVLADVGVACSVGSYYYFIKAIDSYHHGAFAMDSNKLSPHLTHGISLKIASLAFMAPLVSQKNHGELFLSVEELGSFWMGSGIYLLEQSYKKFQASKQSKFNSFAEEAKQDLCMGTLLTTLGAGTLTLIHKVEDC